MKRFIWNVLTIVLIGIFVYTYRGGAGGGEQQIYFFIKTALGAVIFMSIFCFIPEKRRIKNLCDWGEILFISMINLVGYGFIQRGGESWTDPVGIIMILVSAVLIYNLSSRYDLFTVSSGVMAGMVIGIILYTILAYFIFNNSIVGAVKNMNMDGLFPAIKGGVLWGAIGMVMYVSTGEREGRGSILLQMGALAAFLYTIIGI